MDASDFSKPASSLSVFAPTSQLDSASTRLKQPGRAKLTARSKLPTVGLETATNLTTNRGGLRSPATDSGFTLDLDQSGTLAAETLDPQDSEEVSFLAGAISCLPSWMVSLIVHLALILILALSSFGIGAGDRLIELEFAESPSSFDIMQTEIEFENVVIDDEQAMLEQAQTESYEPEEVVIPLDMFGVFALENESESSMTFGPIADVPDSKTPRSGGKGKGAEFFGTKSYGSRFVFVIDCSLSMKGNRWYRAVKELNLAIDGLGEEQEFLVLLYNTQNSVMLDTPSKAAELVQATLDNKDSCRRWLRKKRPTGGTFPASSMFIALSLDPDAIFLLSDGELQDNTRDLLKFWNTEQPGVDGDYAKIPIHTISLGGEGEGQRKMKAIADENEGDFTWVR